MLHSPVMLEESIDFLITNPSGLYIDATFGRGGHSRKILDKTHLKWKIKYEIKNARSILIHYQCNHLKLVMNHQP